MRRPFLLAGLGVLTLALPVFAACCYFAAKDKDILQPAQKAFVTFDPVENVETFTVQPRFEGNASDFGMVIPTPSKPKLDEMPRDFFKELAVFTILEPMDIQKYKSVLLSARAKNAGAPDDDAKKDGGKSTVKVLEAGVVGSLDYKIIVAERADDLYEWLKMNQYSYSGDEATLDFYVQKKWFFTVMKIDTKQMKAKPDGSFLGEVTPTRFTFSSDKCVYPLKITQISIKDSTEALFYIQAPHKVDLQGDASYQYNFAPMWSQALTFAVPEKVTDQEKAWQKVVAAENASLTKANERLATKRIPVATLEWARKITDGDLEILDGKKAYNRDAPKEDVEKLKILKGHIKKGQFVTKLRKVFTKGEMDHDLEFVRAKLGNTDDDIEYTSILPTSPP